MNIDIVIGNPPYNNDMYIPFVEMGHQLAKKCSVFITPAKWQAKGGKLNEQFRKNIVPHMSKIVYYQDTKEVFNDVALSDGVSYYLINKKYKTENNTADLTTVKGGNKINSEWFNNSIRLDIGIKEQNIINNISRFPSYMASKRFKPQPNPFGVPNINDFNYRDGLIEQWEDKNSDIELVNQNGLSVKIDKNKIKNKELVHNYKLCISVRTFENQAYTSYILEPNKVMGRAAIVLYIGTKDECEYANSFFSSKLVWFLTGRIFKGCAISNENNVWRFVPDPGPFDHIFTDEELYKKYNIAPEQIDIIESVIKERK